MNYPRVLIFGQPFNDFSGGGITLSGLFGGWHKDSLAVVSYPFMLHNSSTDICRNYYQIGEEELIWIFPFSRIKQKFPSGKLTMHNQGRIPVLKQTRSIRNIISSDILTPVTMWTGLIHCISSIHLSPRLKNWILDFSPDLVYFQISNRESINFAIELIDFLKIPSVIHMMDDWPSTISSQGPLAKYWQRKIDSEFRSLLDKTDIQLSISEGMSEEYYKRFDKSFRAFHNPIDPERFRIGVVRKNTNDKTFSVLYIGRIGVANKNSLDSFATFVSKYPSTELRVNFDIFTKDFDSRYARRLKKMSNVQVREAVSHNKVPHLLKSYDLLLLPLDFNKAGLKFSRLSMPTKASEYMMSGTPMLVLAPEVTAISRFCMKNQCGHCVSSPDNVKLAEAITLLVEDSEYRERLSANAIKLAKKLFDVQTVHEEFRILLAQLHEQESRN